MEDLVTKDGICCSAFGRYRRERYSEFYFCANCDDWDAAFYSATAGQIARWGTRFSCLASHDPDSLFPTHRLEDAPEEAKKVQKRQRTTPSAPVLLTRSKRRAPVTYKEETDSDSESAASATDSMPPLGPPLVETVDSSSSDEEDKKPAAKPKQKRSGPIVRKQHNQSSGDRPLFKDHGTYQYPDETNEFCLECTPEQPEDELEEPDELVGSPEKWTENNDPRSDAEWEVWEDFNVADVAFVNHHPKGSSPVRMYRPPTESEHVRIGLLEKQLAEANKQLTSLTHNFRASNARAAYQQKAHDAAKGQVASAKEKIRKNLPIEATQEFLSFLSHDRFLSRKEVTLKRWASEVAKEILLKEYDPSEPSPLAGHLRKEIERVCKKLFRNKTFTPVNLLRAMDFHGATLSYSGIKVLRTVESKGEICQGDIPSMQCRHG